MANIKIAYTVSGLLPGNVAVITWHKYNDPTEIGRLIVDGIAVPFAGTFVIEGLQPIMYDIFFHESADNGDTLGAQIASPLRLDASQTTENTVAIYRYTVGRGDSGTDPDWHDPVDGDSSIYDERYEGAEKADIEIFLPGIGYLGQEQFNLLPNSIELLNGLALGEGNNIVVRHYIKKVVSATVTVKTLEEINLVQGDDEGNSIFDASMHFKNNKALYNGVRLTTTFPNFNTIPDCYAIFSTFLGAQRYWSLYFPFNTAWFQGQLRNYIHLAPNEYIVAQFIDHACYLDKYIGTYPLAGTKAFGEWEMQNTKLVNQGHWDTTVPDYNIADYIRLYEALPESMKVSYANYNASVHLDLYKIVDGVPVKYIYYPNRAKFAKDETNGLFKFPSVGGLTPKFIKSVEGNQDMIYGATVPTNRFSQGFGSIEPNRILEHSHRAQQSAGGNNAKALGPNSGFAGRDNAVGWSEYPNLIEETGSPKMVTDNFGGALLIYL